MQSCGTCVHALRASEDHRGDRWGCAGRQRELGVQEHVASQDPQWQNGLPCAEVGASSLQVSWQAGPHPAKEALGDALEWGFDPLALNFLPALKGGWE